MNNQELDSRISYVNDILNITMPKVSGLQSTVLDAMNYSMSAGGKRVRPILMLETYKMFKDDWKDNQVLNNCMCALEMIHTSSLVHDDLPAVDNDDYRRGKPTTHKQYGEQIGIYAGDALLNFAYETMLSVVPGADVNTQLLACSILARKAGVYGMLGGQTVDVALTGQPIDEQQLDFIFKLKTGALIESAMMAGAALAGADNETIELCGRAGLYIGLAFQIQDDILDVTSTTEELGKPVLSDDKNNKTTYVTLYGMEKSVEDVSRYSMQALDIIKSLGKNEFLIDYVEYLINRKN